MIDKGEIEKAKSILSTMYEDIPFTENEKDIKLLIHSLLGILKKNYGRTHEEQIEGLKIIDSTRALSEEIKLLYERMLWLQINPKQLQMEVPGERRQLYRKMASGMADEFSLE